MTPEEQQLREDQQLRDTFAALDPEGDRVAVMEQRILDDYATAQKSLAAEWLELFGAGPVLNATYALAAAAGVAIFTPVGSLLLAFLIY